MVHGPLSFNVVFYLEKINNQFVSLDANKTKVHNEPKRKPFLVATLPDKQRAANVPSGSGTFYLSYNDSFICMSV